MALIEIRLFEKQSILSIKYAIYMKGIILIADTYVSCKELW
jgi:hypothetical protein